MHSYSFQISSHGRFGFSTDADATRRPQPDNRSDGHPDGGASGSSTQDSGVDGDTEYMEEDHQVRVQKTEDRGVRDIKYMEDHRVRARMPQAAHGVGDMEYMEDRHVKALLTQDRDVGDLKYMEDHHIRARVPINNSGASNGKRRIKIHLGSNDGKKKCVPSADDAQKRQHRATSWKVCFGGKGVDVAYDAVKMAHYRSDNLKLGSSDTSDSQLSNALRQEKRSSPKISVSYYTPQ